MPTVTLTRLIPGGEWHDPCRCRSMDRFHCRRIECDITKTCEAFLSFNISGIPSNATITEVKIDFDDYSTQGNLFGSLES
jgi:hypothetical protein